MSGESHDGIDPFAIYVQDYGAPIGWRLYVRSPERITAIVTQNGNAYEEGFVDTFWAPLWRWAVDGNEVDGRAAWSTLTEELVRWQYTHGLADPSLHETFRRHPVPLLAVWGERDEIFGPDGARAFARDLPEAQVELLDGGHFLLESHLDEVATSMRSFLKQKINR